MIQKIRSLVEKNMNRVSELRCQIHRHPELSKNEVITASLAASELRRAGLEVTEGVGGHGVVALLRGGKNGPCVALRADMDALPLEEKTGHPCSSAVKGVMHACGHDVHTAVLLGAALVLSEMKNEIAGSVKFLFQPAEEDNPVGGAPGMIACGVLKNPDVKALFGMHVWPSLQTGTVGTREGPLMGASDRFFLTVSGQGSHGAEPENGVDAIVMAAGIIMALQTVVARNVSPLDSAVVTIGTIRGGSRYNVVADEVILEGTVRTVDPETQEKMPLRIGTIARGVAEGMGGKCVLEYIKGYPPLMNSPGTTKTALSALEKTVGKNNIVLVEKPALIGEDFSFFSREVPSQFLWLGCRPEGVEKEKMPPLHSSCFLPDEKAIPIGVEVLAACVMEELRAEG